MLRVEQSSAPIKVCIHAELPENLNTAPIKNIDMEFVANRFFLQLL